MEDEFTLFTQRFMHGLRIPVVTVQLRGDFGLNKEAYDAMEQPAAVELLFADKSRRIAFRPTHVDSPHSYPVRKQGRVDSYAVSGKAFLRYHGIPFDVSRRYRAEMQNGM